jgi:hypothetical protein
MYSISFSVRVRRCGILAGSSFFVGMAACSSSTETKPKFAAVVGFVSTASGSVLSGISVRATSFFDTCGGTPTASNDAVTDASGHYRIRLTSAGGQDPACVAVVAVRIQNGARDSVTSSGDLVHFDFDRSTGSEDSVRVDLHLP